MKEPHSHQCSTHPNAYEKVEKSGNKSGTTSITCSHSTKTSNSSRKRNSIITIEILYNPHDVASDNTIKNDSVNEQFKNTCPCVNTFHIFSCGTDPKNFTRCYVCSRLTISSNDKRFDPSLPIMKSAFGNLSHSCGIVPTNESTPLR